MKSSNDEILRFIASSFRSVWALELLLVLKSERGSWSHDDLNSTMRASKVVVTRALGALEAAGLVTISGDRAQYAPVSDEVAALVEEAERLYASRPDAVLAGDCIRRIPRRHGLRQRVPAQEELTWERSFLQPSMCFASSPAPHAPGSSAGAIFANGTRLLLWSSICFCFLAANNLALVLDLVVLPSDHLHLARLLLALAAVVSLIWGFVWKVEDV